MGRTPTKNAKSSGVCGVKVLFATYPMAFHTPGGGEIQLLAYKKYMPAHGVDVFLFDQWYPRFLEYDVVHFFSCVGGSVHFCNFVKQLGIPLVISSSLWITEETKHLYPVDEIRAQLNLADKIIANSDIESDTLSQVLNLPREKFVTVYNGVDDLFFNHISPDIFKQRFGINQPFILNVGNIEPRKNQLRLVQAMKAFPGYKLVLIGYARNQEYFQSVMNAGGDQVMYLGTIPHEDMLLRSAYSASDIFVLPSTLETPGLAALEAAAVGVTIVLTSVGSTREYFGDMVHYVDPLNINSIQEGIQSGINFNLSGRQKEEFSTKIRQHFKWDVIIPRLKDLYRKINQNVVGI